MLSCYHSHVCYCRRKGAFYNNWNLKWSGGLTGRRRAAGVRCDVMWVCWEGGTRCFCFINFTFWLFCWTLWRAWVCECVPLTSWVKCQFLGLNLNEWRGGICTRLVANVYFLFFLPNEWSRCIILIWPNRCSLSHFVKKIWKKKGKRFFFLCVNDALFFLSLISLEV